MHAFSVAPSRLGRRLPRAASLLIAFAIVCATMIALPVQEARADRASAFMKKVTTALLRASRKNSSVALERVIARYADVPYIGRYSLGRYARALPRRDRARYQRGMVRFMARYAAGEAPKYPVRNVRVLSRGFRISGGIGVDTRVVLRNGTSYDIRWLLVRRGGTYKVRDVQVVGIWILQFQRTLFRKFIEEKGGRVAALVRVLTR